MNRILIFFWSLILVGGFVYASDTEFENDGDYDSDESYDLTELDHLDAFADITLCLPLDYFPRGGTYFPHLVEDEWRVVDRAGQRVRQHVVAQEAAESVGPLNPLTTELHIQGVHGSGIGSSIIFFQAEEALEGQLDGFDGTRVTAVGPITFGGDAYVIVPEGAGYTLESTGFIGRFITYDPEEMTAQDALNDWLLEREGWYLRETDNVAELQVVVDGGEVLERHETEELNTFWAEEHGLLVESYEDSIFAKMDVLVQRVFWRHYRVQPPESIDELEACWLELQGILDELFEEEYWDESARVYLENYGTLLNIWYAAFDDQGLLAPAHIYIPPPVIEGRMAAATVEVFRQIGIALEDEEAPFLWPTGRVRMLNRRVVLDEFVLYHDFPLIHVLEAPVEVGWRAPIDSFLGGYECWF